MGIFSFFNKNKENKQNNVQQYPQQEEKYPEMKLDYMYSGERVEAVVRFKDVINYTLQNGKSTHLQAVEIEYTGEEGGFHVRRCYMDPIVMADENNQQVYNSAAYFENLKRQNPKLVKAFFERNNLSKLPSDYLGHLKRMSDGNYSRSYNQENGFYADYVAEHKRKLKERESAEQAKVDNLKAELTKGVNAPHEVSYETTYRREKLTPEMYKEMYGNNPPR